MSAIDLNKLPAISFAPLEPAAVERAVFADYERRRNTTLYPGDPVRLFLESLAYDLTVQNNIIDLAAKQTLLAYASGANLDHLGALMGVARIPAQPAICLVRFHMAQKLDFAVPVPQGSRVTTRDGKVIFSTLAYTEIAPGFLYADCLTICQQPGSAGSGLLPGQIECLIDPLPYISGVENIDATHDGADIESDSRLRERIRIAPETFTVAGSIGQYEALTLGVSADISAVSVTSPEPGVVDIRFVLDGGVLPDAAMCQLVYDALSAEDVRPLTDMLVVGAPEPVGYSVRGSWKVKRGDAPLLMQISANVQKALADYLAWQRSRPGRDIVPSKLVAMIQDAGAKRVEIEEPVFTKLSGIQIAAETSVSLTFAGMEEE